MSAASRNGFVPEQRTQTPTRQPVECVRFRIRIRIISSNCLVYTVLRVSKLHGLTFAFAFVSASVGKDRSKFQRRRVLQVSYFTNVQVTARHLSYTMYTFCYRFVGCVQSAHTRFVVGTIHRSWGWDSRLDICLYFSKAPISICRRAFVLQFRFACVATRLVVINYTLVIFSIVHKLFQLPFASYSMHVLTLTQPCLVFQRMHSACKFVSSRCKQRFATWLFQKNNSTHRNTQFTRIRFDSMQLRLQAASASTCL